MPDKRTDKVLLAFKGMIEAGVIEVKLDEDLADWAEQIATLTEDEAEEPTQRPRASDQSWQVIPDSFFDNLAEGLRPGRIVPIAEEPVDDVEMQRWRMEQMNAYGHAAQMYASQAFAAADNDYMDTTRIANDIPLRSRTRRPSRRAVDFPPGG